MSTPTQTAHPYDSARRYPDGEGSIPVDWSDRGEYGEDDDRWTSYETVDYDGHTLVATPFGSPVGALIDGEYHSVEDIRALADEEDAQRTERDEVTDEDSDEDDGNEDDGDEPEGPYRALANAIGEAEGDACGYAAEGPMMNFFYLLERGGPYSRTPDLAQWAAQLDGLPLCAVEYNGDYGLALTGGGMDLSWEIAEAHLRLGYRVPTWVDLPAMAQGGRLGKDYGGTTPLDEDDAAMVRAAIRDRRAAAERHTYAADRLAERYGIVETEER